MTRRVVSSSPNDTSTWFNGKTAIFIGIKQAPGANPLTVARRVHELLPELRAQLPAGLEIKPVTEDQLRQIWEADQEAFKVFLDPQTAESALSYDDESELHGQDEDRTDVDALPPEMASPPDG